MSNNTNNNNFSQYRINKRSQNVNNSKTVSCIACNPKGEKPNIIVGFDDGMIKLFNFDIKGKYRCTYIFHEHTDTVNYILFNPINPNIISSCSTDHSIILWNIINDTIEFEKYDIPENSEHYSSKIAFNYDGSILCFRYDYFLRVFKINYYRRNNSIHLVDNSISRLYNLSDLSDNGFNNDSLYFHPNKNILFIGYNDPESIVVYSVNDLCQLTELLIINLNDDNIDKYFFSSCINITGDILFLVDTCNRVLNIFDMSEDITFEKRKEYDLKKYFNKEPDITLIFHPKNPEILMLYDFFNIIILQITSSRIECLYLYKHEHREQITSCSFNFLGNAIIFSSKNKIVILELKLNIVNNNHSNKKTNMMRMLGNISVSN